MSYKLNPNLQYQMPVHFGPAIGPRQTEDGGRYLSFPPASTHEITVLYETDPEILSEILPPKCALIAPVVAVRTAELRNIPWLAGKGYNLTMVLIPIRYEGEEKRSGFFVPVIWENHGDPIVTGREQIGWNKIFAGVTNIKSEGKTLAAETSSWDFPFFSILVSPDSPPQQPEKVASLLSIIQNPEGGFFHHKYIPSTKGTKNEADVDYLTFLPFASVTSSEEDVPAEEKGFFHLCGGQVVWKEPKWEEMPTQCRIAGYFSRLPILNYLGATHSLSHSHSDLMDQRPIY